MSPRGKQTGVGKKGEWPGHFTLRLFVQRAAFHTNHTQNQSTRAPYPMLLAASSSVWSPSPARQHAKDTVRATGRRPNTPHTLSALQSPASGKHCLHSLALSPRLPRVQRHACPSAPPPTPQLLPRSPGECRGTCPADHAGLPGEHTVFWAPPISRPAPAPGPSRPRALGLPAHSTSRITVPLGVSQQRTFTVSENTPGPPGRHLVTTPSLLAPVHAWPHLPRVLPTAKPAVNSLTYFSNLTRGPWTGSGVVRPD